MTDPSIHVIIAGGRRLFREGLSLLLEKQPGLKVVGEAEDIRHVPRLLKALPVQIVMMRIKDADPQDVNALRAILRTRPGVRVILLTLSPEIDRVREIISSGAMACLTKEAAGTEVVAAIEAVMQGRVYLSPALTNRVINRHVASTQRGQDQRDLAPREREVLQLIARGQSGREIATALSVSKKTIETHRRRIMSKLNCHSDDELTQHATANGLIGKETLFEAPHR